MHLEYSQRIKRRVKRRVKLKEYQTWQWSETRSDHGQHNEQMLTRAA